MVHVVAGPRISTSSEEGFVLALTQYGDVYSWGKGYKGRLGHHSTENVRTPKLIDALSSKDVKMVCVREREGKREGERERELMQCSTFFRFHAVITTLLFSRRAGVSLHLAPRNVGSWVTEEMFRLAPWDVSRKSQSTTTQMAEPSYPMSKLDM